MQHTILLSSAHIFASPTSRQVGAGPVVGFTNRLANILPGIPLFAGPLVTELFVVQLGQSHETLVAEQACPRMCEVALDGRRQLGPAPLSTMQVFPLWFVKARDISFVELVDLENLSRQSGSVPFVKLGRDKDIAFVQIGGGVARADSIFLSLQAEGRSRGHLAEQHQNSPIRSRKELHLEWL